MDENIKKNGKIKNLLLLGKLGNGTGKQAFFLWLMVAVWSYYIVGGIIMLAVFTVLTVNKNTRKTIFSDRRQIVISIVIPAFSLLVSLCYGNYTGALLSAAIFIILILGCYIKSGIDKESYEKASVLCCYGSIIACICAALQNFIIFGYNPDYRPTAGAFNANYYGALIAFTYILCIVRIFDGETTEKGHPWYRPTKIFYLMTVVINITALLLCESRSALLAVMVCTLVFLALKRQYVLFGAAVLLGAGLWAFCWFHPETLSWTNSLSYIITERSTIWKDAMKSYVSTPLSVIAGRGPMTYLMVWEKEGLYGANHVHNIIFDTLLNTGIIGLLLYGYLFYLFIKAVIGYYKDKNKSGLIISVMLLFEILVQGMADVTIMWHQTALLFFILFYQGKRSKE